MAEALQSDKGMRCKLSHRFLVVLLRPFIDAFALCPDVPCWCIYRLRHFSENVGWITGTSNFAFTPFQGVVTLGSPAGVSRRGRRRLRGQGKWLGLRA